MTDNNQHISTDKIQNIIAQLGLSPKDHLSEEELSAVIARLNEGPFDKDTFQQIWDQCQLNSKGQVKLSQFMEYVLKAEAILLENIKKTNIAIYKLESNKPDQNDYSQLHLYRQQLDSLYDQKTSLTTSLNIIRKPFQHYFSNPVSNAQKNTALQEDPKQQLFEYNFNDSVSTLTKIIYLTLTVLILTLLGSQMFNQFVDITLCLLVLSGYAFESISRKIIKLNLVLLSFSFVYDILWLAIYTGPMWNPNKNYQYAHFTAGYLQFSICMLILTQFVKLILIYYYLTLLNINELETYSVSFCYKSILMKADPILSPFHPLSYALVHVFNPKIPESEQPVRIIDEPIAK